MVIKVGTDCSGIEAPVVALKILGKQISHLFSCEYDKNVRKTIEGNFTPEKIYEDITKRDHKKVPKVDLYFCGFPCQSFSTAGKQAGFEDPRGTIFFHCHEYIKYRKPNAFVLENVKGLVNHDKGNTFKVIMGMCNELKDYNIYHKVLNSINFGVPQNRERIFIVGIKKKFKKEFSFPKGDDEHPDVWDILESHKKGDKFETLTDWELGNLEHFIDKYKKKGIDIEKECYILDIGASKQFASIMNNVSPCLKASRSNYYITNLERKFTPRECLRLQGFKDDLFKQICSDHQTYKQAGNSITVNVLAAIIDNILKVTE